MKPQKITAKPQHALVTTWFEATSWLFFSKELAFLPELTFKKQTAEFGIDLEAKFTTGQVFLLSYKKIQIKNHQSQATGMTLWSAREAHWSAMCLIGSFFLSFSDMLSSLVWSFLLDSTSLSCQYVTKRIIHIYSMHINKLKYKNNNFSI